MSSNQAIESNNLSHNWNFSRDFPSIDESSIERPSFLETIVDILTPSNPVVFLEGDEGDGATTTLAQFCKKYPDQTFSLFVKPASRFAYSPEYLRLTLAEQLYWYVFGQSFDKPFIDESEFQVLIHHVRKKRKSAELYFVVDGVHQIPAEDARLVESIFREVLPIGMDNFRFVITGQQSRLGKYVNKVSTKPYQQLKFSLEDTRQYLSTLNLAEVDISEIHKICKGVPGRVASIKRLLISGKDLKLILDSDLERYLEFIKLEFDSLDALTSSQLSIVTTLAFSKQIINSEEILLISKSTQQDFDEVLGVCKFLSAKNPERVVDFVSETHRKFAEKRLADYQSESLSRQVEYLLHYPDSDVALRFLPTYYQQLNQQQAIVDLLSAEHFSKLLDTTESISALINRAELGARSAAQLKQTTGIFKFALQRSIFNAVSSQDAIESEVTALVALDQPQKALKIANSSVSKESRLSLLVTYAKRVKKVHGIVDPELLSFIKDLSSEVDFSVLGDQAVEIAADIVSFDPDLAVAIVEQAHKGQPDPKKKDAAFTHLSIAASLSGGLGRTEVDDKAKKRISDAALQKLANSVSLLVESLSAKEILATVEQMEKEHRLYFIKIIVAYRKDQEGILDVVEYALDLMIQDTAYTPKSSDLADLAIPLPYSTKETERLKKLIVRFESQIGLVAKSAFSKDLSVLQMRIAHAELSFDEKRATDRIEQAYYEVASIKTPEVQTECYAIMLNVLDEIDRDNALEKKHGFKAVVKQELTNVIDRILANIADQTEGISGAMSALARHDCCAALDLASKLNTENRRDKAYRTVAEIISTQKFTSAKEEALRAALGKIVSSKVRSEAVLTIMDTVVRNKDKAQWIEKVATLLTLIDNPTLACTFIIKELAIRVELGQTPNVPTFVDQLSKLIEKVDSKLEVIDLYYQAVEGLARIDLTEANRYYEMGRSLKADTNPNTAEALQIIELCLSLIARSYGALMKANLLTGEMEQRFSNLVDLIPCAYTRAKIFADLAIRAWCVNRVDLCKSIVNAKCKPLIEEAIGISDYLHARVIGVTFTACCLSHSASAFPLLDHLSLDDADDALYATAMSILHKLPPLDPTSDEGFSNVKHDVENAIELLGILSRVNSDNAFYWILDSMVDAFTSKTNSLTYSAQQKADYANKIREQIATKLPDKRNIQHVGYKVASIAQTYRLQEHAYPDWLSLENDAKTIGNIADRAYVLIELSKCMHAKLGVHRKRLLDEALVLIDNIPSPIDRLAHYEGYARIAAKSSAASAKVIIQRAISLSAELEATAQVELHRRQLIDIADRLEDGFADKLIELIDDDPARANAKMELQRSASLNKAKREIANTKAIKDIKQHDSQLMPDAVWRNVASLLAGRLETKRIDIMAEYVLASGANSIWAAYPTLTWYLENAARKYSAQRDISEQILPISEAMLLSTEMAMTVLAQESQKTSEFNMQVSMQQSKVGTMVCAGEREQALQYISSWLRANAVGYIKYSYPYFGPDDLPFLQMVLSECPECRVHILTSKQHLQKKDALNSDRFQEVWRKLSDQDPPETEIIAISAQGNDKGLIHDRWMLSKNCGLRIGTSFNSIGAGKLSEISEMEPAKAKTCELQLDKYLAKQRKIDEIKVSYLSFTL